MKSSFLIPLATVAAIAVVPAIHAKLPPPSAQAQAQADEAKSKTAWSDKVGAYQVCRAMERVAEGYFKSAKASGVATHAPTPTPPCTDPGPYVSAAAASTPKPLEASEAHSPASNATSPPSSQATQAEIKGMKK